MEQVYAKIDRFLSACDDLIAGKFILADSKIGELLKSVASSKELTELFSAVTEKFDYTAAKKAYLRFPSEKGAAHGAAFLPVERGDILAFVFCLLVEFDAGSIRFNDFLLRYFYEDGSYTASYALFVDRMIRPFRDIVRDCFPAAGKRGQVLRMEQKEDETFAAVSERVSVERNRIASLSASDEDKDAGDLILAELYAAAGRGDAQEVRALLCGYCYYLRCIRAEDESSEELFSVAEKLFPKS